MVLILESAGSPECPLSYEVRYPSEPSPVHDRHNHPVLLTPVNFWSHIACTTTPTTITIAKFPSLVKTSVIAWTFGACLCSVATATHIAFVENNPSTIWS